MKLFKTAAYFLVAPSIVAGLAGCSGNNKSTKPESSLSQTKELTNKPKQGEIFGQLVIDSINFKAPILELAPVVGNEQLNENYFKKGVGHIQGTVFPGEPDCSVLSAHNITDYKVNFNKLGDIKVGDEIKVVYNGSSTHQVVYKVRKAGWVTSSDDKTVATTVGRPIVRLVTCYPFNQRSTTDKRYVVEAELEKVTDK